MASISLSGSKLNYAGEAGGPVGISTSGDFGNYGRLALDAEGNAYLAGVTNDPSFPGTRGTLSPTVPGYPFDSAFVMKVDPTGSLVYATIISGLDTPDPALSYVGDFVPSGIPVDSQGRVTLAGTGGPGLPTTPGALPVGTNTLTATSTPGRRALQR